MRRQRVGFLRVHGAYLRRRDVVVLSRAGVGSRLVVRGPVCKEGVPHVYPRDPAACCGAICVTVVGGPGIGLDRRASGFATRGVPWAGWAGLAAGPLCYATRRGASRG